MMSRQEALDAFMRASEDVATLELAGRCLGAFPLDAMVDHLTEVFAARVRVSLTSMVWRGEVVFKWDEDRGDFIYNLAANVGAE